MFRVDATEALLTAPAWNKLKVHTLRVEEIVPQGDQVETADLKRRRLTVLCSLKGLKSVGLCSAGGRGD